MDYYRRRLPIFHLSLNLVNDTFVLLKRDQHNPPGSLVHLELNISPVA